MCIISLGSHERIYHQRGCHYEVRIKNKDKIEMSKKKAKRHGYEPCTYCYSMHFILKKEKGQIEKYLGEQHMMFAYHQGAVYIKTDIDLWKIIYVHAEEKFILFHANQLFSTYALENVMTAHYHLQRDVKPAAILMHHLVYIKKHDEYHRQVARANGNEMAVSVNKKYAAQREKRLKCQFQRNIMQLFNLIEQEHPEYKKLAFC